MLTVVEEYAVALAEQSGIRCLLNGERSEALWGFGIVVDANTLPTTKELNFRFIKKTAGLSFRR